MTLSLIWLSGAILFLSVFTIRYIREITRLNRYPSKDGITIVPGCAVPMSVGVFRKRILLPKQDYTEQELHYILLHERAHFAHHDHLIKMLVQIICCVFWWNPLIYLLQREISQMIELRCDRAVTQNLTPEEKEEYLSVLLTLVKDSRRGGRTMLERFRQVAGKRPRPHRRRVSTLAMAFVLACLGPGMVKSWLTFQPMPPRGEIYTDSSVWMPAFSGGHIELGRDMRYYFVTQGEQTYRLHAATVDIFSQAGYSVVNDDPCIREKWQHYAPPPRPVEGRGVLTLQVRCWQGRMQYRRWNGTRGCWADGHWRCL